MGRLGYDPDNLDDSKGGGKSSPPGRYPFIVVDAVEKDFKGGQSRGLRVILEVAVGSRDIKVYENLIYGKSSQWRLKQFLEATGFDYEDPPDVDDIFDAEGVADFKLGPKKDGGKRYLEVDHFLERGTQATGPHEKGSAGAGSQPPLPSRRRGRSQSRDDGDDRDRGRSQSRSRSQSSGGGGGRRRRRRKDDEDPPRAGGGMLSQTDEETPKQRRGREDDEDGLGEDEIPF